MSWPTLRCGRSLFAAVVKEHTKVSSRFGVFIFLQRAIWKEKKDILPADYQKKTVKTPQKDLPC